MFFQIQIPEGTFNFCSCAVSRRSIFGHNFSPSFLYGSLQSGWSSHFVTSTQAGACATGPGTCDPFGEFAFAKFSSGCRSDERHGFVSRKVSDEYGITTISDLQAHAADIRFASQGEFDEREDGIPGLEKVYGPFAWKSSKVYDNGLKYQVVENDEADAAPAYTTEGRLVETDKSVLLEDDKQVWPPYNIAPVVRDEVLEAYPQIAEILNPISAALDTETVTALNAQVDIDQEEYEDVALDFYESIK
ncbi:MAG: hypothetical protein IKE25_06165 [Clostridia bacterium]|nr:hypothetical protein [Clostridia bacterium]